MKICRLEDCLECLDKCYGKTRTLRLVASNPWVKKVTIKDLRDRDIFVVHSRPSTTE